mmetsp:Transcript_1306/g.1755  ORF Transcript_1306/g.1755 Transcript_1306/m.1755 type:complete len:126 (-) Transcript_1306:206-583(-)|eukprot:CAMPEP_0116062708 /NCGR_PEP_ID=MMETSP0322-20121206/7944_1 /TAXON_ID=163516 /ORGANISM="Leptocylindrus danicus var. apora, Strain B651" /LENGTH=125 /DNA_ID=CAMNT_0003548115 /DNA_START=376 /DNA_END=753 /DNA_ORIENTATION=+
MTSRILSVARLIFLRGGVYASTAKANGWAQVALWRRFFAEQEAIEEEEECRLNQEVQDEARERIQRGTNATEIMIRHNLDAIRRANNDDLERRRTVEREARSQSRIDTPNLQIPTSDGTYTTLAQ